MTLKYNVEEAKSWDDDEAKNIIAYIKARPWLQRDLDRIVELRGEEAVADESASGNDYSSLTVDELQDQLRDRDLPVSGNKDELIARLQEADA